MSGNKKGRYVTLNVKLDTFKEVRRYAGEVQAKTGARMTEDAAVKSLLKNAAITRTE